MVDKKGKDKTEERDDLHGAATLAVQHVIKPANDRLVEVSNIPLGATHSLTMLQAFEGEINILLDQIKAMQDWYIYRKLKRQMMENKGGKLVFKEDFDQMKFDNVFAAETAQRDIDDCLDTDDLFIHKFRHAYFQVSRGKEGKLLELLGILADTDLQNRALEQDDIFKNPIRKQ